MDKEKKRAFSLAPFSNTPVSLKFAVMVIMLIMSVMLIWTAMVRTISLTQKEKYKQMENTAVTAAEQVMNMSVESAVSIAKNIYTNDTVYEFLNTKYSSSAEYYEAYYELQRNTAMNVAETNIIKNCVIYTQNPTILSGGDIKSLSLATNEYWYKKFMEMGKSTLLCIDPDKKEIILVRKLDYMAVDEGESYLCVNLNTKVITEFSDNLGFDGELYIMSGSYLLYSSDKSIESAEQVDIDQFFECLTRNYYTTDINFYSCATKKGLRDFVILNQKLLILLLAIIVVAVMVGHLFSSGIKKRTKRAVTTFKNTGSIDYLEKGRNGRDEIGKLLDIYSDMTEKLLRKGSEFQISSDSLMRKNSDYATLFSTAMRLDAELAIADKYPEIKVRSDKQLFPLSEEADLMSKLALKLDKNFRSTPIYDEKLFVPAYSFVLISEDFFRNFNGSSVDISVTDNSAAITFESSSAADQGDILKLRAIFEDNNISNEYSFDKNYRFNPYLRIKHCLGSSIDLEIIDDDKLRLIFTLKEDTKKGDKV